MKNSMRFLLRALETLESERFAETLGFGNIDESLKAEYHVQVEARRVRNKVFRIAYHIHINGGI